MSDSVGSFLGTVAGSFFNPVLGQAYAAASGGNVTKGAVKLTNDVTGVTAVEEQKKQTQIQNDRQNSLLQDAQNKQTQDEQLAAGSAAQAEARRRQQSSAALAQGRRSTILTSPLGASSAPATGGRTILGG